MSHLKTVDLIKKEQHMVCFAQHSKNSIELKLKNSVKISKKTSDRFYKAGFSTKRVNFAVS